jgi:hypothetical protein
VILLQSTTFDDWATPMYALMRSSSPHVWIYFVLIVILGGWFVGACVARAPSADSALYLLLSFPPLPVLSSFPSLRFTTLI